MYNGPSFSARFFPSLMRTGRDPISPRENCCTALNHCILKLHGCKRETICVRIHLRKLEYYVVLESDNLLKVFEIIYILRKIYIKDWENYNKNKILENFFSYYFDYDYLLVIIRIKNNKILEFSLWEKEKVFLKYM